MQTLFAPANPTEKLVLRPYQEDAVQAIYRHLREYEDNPVAELPTAAGKTPILSTICRDVVEQWQGRVIVLAHVKELLAQAHSKLQAVAPHLPIGIYSAGLGRRDVHSDIVLAGIQSVYRKAATFGRRDLVIVDEAHLIPADGDGMYRTFINGIQKVTPHARVIGLTATPYRMDSGPLCKPGGILNAICYRISVKELIGQGFLTPLISRAGGNTARADLANIPKTKTGEFIEDEMAKRFDQGDLVSAAVNDLLAKAKDRRAVLIFAASVAHAQHVAEKIREHGHQCGVITGDSEDMFRDQTIKDFAAGNLRFLVNVNVLTTGFDATIIDCVALLRATQSAGLYYQMVGRGFRLHPGKANCLVLDYGGNVMRHGPVDAIEGPSEKTKGTGPAPMKECPECSALILACLLKCPECGHEFPRKDPHEDKADETPIISGEITDEELTVGDTYYAVHTKRGEAPNAPRTLRVDYYYGIADRVSEWICFEHSGWLRQKAEKWWKQRSDYPTPRTAAEACNLAKAGFLCRTLAVTQRTVSGKKFAEIINYQLGPIPRDGSPEFVAAFEEFHKLAQVDAALEEEARRIAPPESWTTPPAGQTFTEDDIPF
jgi:DNA repair protein RadD